MKIRRLASSMAALVLVGGTLVAGAGSASANQVWYQSVGKASAEAPCPTSTGTELAAGWTQWSPSWAMWANQGKGGFVCNREITWAYSETTPTLAGPGCVQWGGPNYLQFGSSNIIPIGSESLFITPDCSGDAASYGRPFVYAPLGLLQAQALCDGYASTEEGWNPFVYVCVVV